MAGKKSVLDQDEVMRAMRAAAEARREGEEGSASGSDSDSASDEDSASDSDSSHSGSDSDDAASSSSLRAKPPSPPVASTSRVKLPAKLPSTKGKASSSPFDVERVKPTTFQDLGLSAPIISALGELNIKAPTEIQSACVPQVLAGRDVIGGAKTGSGKTLAFALPILEKLARDPFGIAALVLTPTRELAYQLAEQFLAVGKPLGLSTITVVGGMDMLTQSQEIERRPHIIVATPGRICALLRSGGISPGCLSRVRWLVLDEADRMLTPTFAPELAYLFEQIPKSRQTLLFTATISDAITDLAKQEPRPGKQRPFVYRVPSDSLTVDKLKQKYLFIPSQIRDPYLFYLLHHPPEDIDAILTTPRRPPPQPKPKQRGKRHRSETPEDEEPPVPSTIIFTQRCATAQLVHLLLEQLGIPSVPLHSQLTQPQRLLSLARFRAGEIPVLVTTDVGSRGLDIPQVAMVINWDCPRRADDYVHRVGRTARAGRGGVAVTIVTERDVELVKIIEDGVQAELAELVLPEDKVLEDLNKVSLARRVATMEMHDSKFGERAAVNQAKRRR